MPSTTMSRRSFLQLAAITASAATVAGAASEPLQALAEVEEGSSNEVKRIRTACRGCGKMECGVWVTVENGRAVKVEGDESARQSNGNCCGKSQASIQAAYHPDRLKYPMKRTNPKGGDPGWQRITWDEAYDAVYQGLSNLYEKYGNTTFTFMTGTSRMWGMSAPGYMQLVDGINDVGAAQICKGPRREAGALTIENGIHFQALVDRPQVLVQWGTDQTQSNYDDSCRTTVEALTRAQTFISVDPRKSNMGKEADYHLALRPGTDGALLMAWTRIVMEEELYDDLLVKRWSNAPFLHVEELEPSGWIGVSGNVSPAFEVKTRLLKESDIKEGGDPKKFMVWDNLHDRLTYFDANEEGEHAGMWEGQTEHDISTTGFEYEPTGGWVPDPMPFPVDIDPALWGEFDVTLKDGRTVKAKPVFQKYWDECVNEMTLEKAAEICDVPAETIYDACKAWATRVDPRRGNGGLNTQLAPEQVGRAIQNFRTAYILAFMTDNYDTPGGNRGVTNSTVAAGGCAAPAKTPPSTEPNLTTRAKIVGGDKFPVTKWWNNWVDQTSVWDACHTGEPYPIKGCVCSAANFMCQSNAAYAWEALQQMEFTFYIDLWPIAGAQLADILVPTRHWLEIPGFPRASQGASGAVGANVNCIDPPAETGFEPEILCNIYKRFGVPFYDTKDGGDAWDRPIEAFLDNAVSSMGMTWKEYVDEFEKNGWWDAKKLYPERWGTYRRYQMGYLRGSGSVEGNLPGMETPTMKAEFWSTILESIIDSEELPHYEEPPMSPVSTPELYEEYPFNMTTGRRIPVYFHSEHRQLPWCRELWPVPRMEINPEDAYELEIEQGDWCWIESKWGKVRQTADLCYGVKRGVINCEHTWWYPELEQADKGFKLSGINCLVNKDAQDPICGSSQLRAYPVKVYKATPENSPFGNPVPCGDDGTEIIHTCDDPRLKEWLPVYEGREE
ncbi:hypothetical protein B5F40_03175 [Gordonibacter sp. An230]|uniref:molybdopterin-containing oxidoreductase family protein n=1 Tax=Gordonibacter sp. An230 TaxID=1965592 RepID=UPI000B3A38F2|nr:molybdopterin dinucleotide binding domain-containing protein [Gordonibacter sp. An230]OUO91454.1 hypothetical protein B5F40_03175 [Gordonibacter sp. An230]